LHNIQIFRASSVRIWGQSNTRALFKVHLRELLGSSFCIQCALVCVQDLVHLQRQRQFWALAYCLLKLIGLSDSPNPRLQ